MHILVARSVTTEPPQPGTPTLSTANNFAEDWFRDALREAGGAGHAARRREVLFAVCFAESYIFEWTRGIVPIGELNTYFPPRKYQHAVAKWKHLPRRLVLDGRIPNGPNLELDEFGTLVAYRNGLVHAAASRPTTKGQRQDEKPYPTKEMLAKKDPGWAVRTVIKLVQDLHKAVGTAAPDYLHYP